jgi:hypothetical protein
VIDGPEINGALTREQRAALDLDVAWLSYRTAFRKRMIEQGYLKHYWRRRHFVGELRPCR